MSWIASISARGKEAPTTRSGGGLLGGADAASRRKTQQDNHAFRACLVSRFRRIFERIFCPARSRSESVAALRSHSGSLHCEKISRSQEPVLKRNDYKKQVGREMQRDHSLFQGKLNIKSVCGGCKHNFSAI